MPIRDARAEDLGAVAALIRALADYEHLGHEVTFDLDTLGHWLFGPTPAARVTLATTEAGDVVGMALWYVTFSTFLGRPGIWLEDLFVRPEARGGGLGRSLLDDLRRRTDGRVEWAVLDWNAPSIAFYEALGARPVTGWTRYRWLPGSPD